MTILENYQHNLHTSNHCDVIDKTGSVSNLILSENRQLQKAILWNQIRVFGNSSGCKSGKIMLALGKAWNGEARSSMPLDMPK